MTIYMYSTVRIVGIQVESIWILCGFQMDIPYGMMG